MWVIDFIFFCFREEIIRVVFVVVCFEFGNFKNIVGKILKSEFEVGIWA